jgi:prepilin-type N-terminal cleavage/methylation domain-containing protein/prepilin-type processing-associated H-X9-DG protein
MFVRQKAPRWSETCSQEIDHPPSGPPAQPVNSRNGASAFTLVELLVVIAIIAILAAMLLPALSKSKAQAQSTVCKNHLHQLGYALQMYVQDYQAYPPLGGILWPDGLEPYYQLQWTNPVYHCPAYRGACVREEDFAFAGSYGYNGYDVGRFSLGGTIVGGVAVPRKESAVVAPSEMYAIMDSRGALASDIEYGGPSQWWGFIWATYNQFETPQSWLSVQNPPQHDSVFNVVFCDTHVKAVRLVDLFNENDIRSWNVNNQNN